MRFLHRLRRKLQELIAPDPHMGIAYKFLRAWALGAIIAGGIGLIILAVLALYLFVTGF